VAFCFAVRVAVAVARIKGVTLGDGVTVDVDAGAVDDGLTEGVDDGITVDVDDGITVGAEDGAAVGGAIGVTVAPCAVAGVPVAAGIAVGVRVDVRVAGGVGVLVAANGVVVDVGKLVSVCEGTGVFVGRVVVGVADGGTGELGAVAVGTLVGA